MPREVRMDRMRTDKLLGYPKPMKYRSKEYVDTLDRALNNLRFMWEDNMSHDDDDD